MEPTRSGDGADGVAAERQPLGEALQGLTMYGLPDGHTALVAYVLIRAQEPNGDLTWIGRSTDETLNPDELLGALVAHRDHVRDELSEWDDEDGEGEAGGVPNGHELMPASDALRGLDITPLPEDWRATEALVLVKMMGCDTGVCWDHRYTAAVNWEELLGVMTRAISTLTDRPTPLRFE
jgi:hypothetical protein